jgi:hypothetical protein
VLAHATDIGIQASKPGFGPVFPVECLCFERVPSRGCAEQSLECPFVRHPRVGGGPSIKAISNMAISVGKLAKALAALLEILPESSIQLAEGTTREARKLRSQIEVAMARLRLLAHHLDPIQRPPFVFDPTNPEFIGKLIGHTLLEQARQPLASIPRFHGSGVYALYYAGDFEAYRPIRGKETPIYVGKADPPTPDAQTYLEQGPKLATRLAEHAKSIRSATTTLRLDDFDGRFLVVQSGWQRSAEDYLVNLFKPIWNSKICFGFGKHGDDPGTRGNTRSPWDTMHPGRRWATKVGNKPNPLCNERIVEQIAEHYRNHPPKQ